MVNDPNACSMPECDGQLGPDSLEFLHKGEPAGGICGLCLADADAIKVFFQKDPEGMLEPRELVHIESLT